MAGKNIGDPCPKCASILIARAKRILARSGGLGDIAYCALCNLAFEIDAPMQSLDRAPAIRPLPA